MDTGQSQEEEVASECHQRAQQALIQGNYGRAFAHYLLLVRMSPAMRVEVKDNMILALREWAEQLEAAGRGHDVLACYQQACDVFPDCETMLSNMGAHLFRLGYIDEAACCFRRALRINPDFLGARENLDNVCGHLVERWHFRMLNDITRNSKFRDAIHAAVENGHSRVLDIGTGTGLLSLFAVEAGATEIYGCEMSKTMYDVACDVLRINQGAEKVTLIHKKSTDMKIPDDISDRVNLIVTETLDAGLLGEHILATLQHAWTHLLVPNEDKLAKKGSNRGSKINKPNSCVIPAGATVYIAAIESEYIRKHNRLLYPGLRHIDLSEVEITCRTGQANGCHGDEEASEWEPYTTERLSSLPGGYKLLSDVTEALQLDFNNPRMIDTYLQGASQDIVMQVIRQGRLDAVALWFDLELYDKIMMSTSPDAESCWEQAVYPVLPSHLRSGGRDSLLVKPGESLLVSCVCNNNALSLQCTELRPASHGLAVTTGTAPGASVAGQGTAIGCPLLCQYSVKPETPVHVHLPTGSTVIEADDSKDTSTESSCSTASASGSGSGVTHTYDLTICKPEPTNTYLYQPRQVQPHPPPPPLPGAAVPSLESTQPGLLPPYGQPHISLAQPLLGAQMTWHPPGSWYHDPLWPHQVQQAWPPPDPRLWHQPYHHQQPYHQNQHQQQHQHQQQLPSHTANFHHQTLDSLSKTSSPSHTASDAEPRVDTSDACGPSQVPVSFTSPTTTNTPSASGTGFAPGLPLPLPVQRSPGPPRELLPSPQQSSDYTSFLRQQLREAVHAAEMDATYRSFVIRSQTAPDVRTKATGLQPVVAAASPTSAAAGAASAKGKPSTSTSACQLAGEAASSSTSVGKTLASGPSVWSQWTWGQPISRSVDSLVTAARQGYLNSVPRENFLLDRYELSRLNDIDSNTAFCAALERIKRGHFMGKGFTLLDLTRGFSTLPLQSLKIGATEVGIMETASQTQTELLCCLAPANGLTASAVRFLCGSIEDVEPEWDVVITELIDHCGALTQQVLEQIALARVTCLRRGGLIVPWSATVYGMVVEAPALLNDSAVISDEHTLDLQVAQFMNDFQMTTHVDITLSTLAYKKLSQPFELFRFAFNECVASKVPDFLTQSTQLSLTAVDSGQATAVVYWFELFLTPEVKLSTVDTKLRWRQAAVMQKSRPDVLAGRPMTIKAVCKNSCIDIKVIIN